ncbi:MAG: hypothetical protein ACR2P6_04615 [Gammaproteobacteria bacterium]
MTFSDPASPRQVLSSFEEVREAALATAAQAERIISIFTPDLEPGIYDDDAFLEIVKRLVLGKRYARVRVLISEPFRTNRNDSALTGVGRRLSSSVAYRNLHEDFQADQYDAFLIADEKAVLYRSDSREWKGILGDNEPAVAKDLLERYSKMWEASEYKYDQRLAHI